MITSWKHSIFFSCRNNFFTKNILLSCFFVSFLLAYLEAMNSENSVDQLFVRRLTDYILSNLEKEHFGAVELSQAIGQSRSTIHRKLKACTQKSLSHFICELRLNKAYEMLINHAGTASEIAYKVGFSSPAYFNKCFHNYFGFPPGELKKGNHDSVVPQIISQSELEKYNVTSQLGFQPLMSKLRLKNRWIIISTGLIFLIFFGYAGYDQFFSVPKKDSIFQAEIQSKSIMIQPFKNISDNKLNQSFADGIMEELLDCISRIENLKLVSRTSAEQASEKNLSIHQIARRMNIDYLLEGSVRSDDDKLKVAVQLIDAKRDIQIWSEQFERKIEDLLMVQTEISSHIVMELEKIIRTSENEQSKIDQLNPILRK
jgi:TolB-like protein/AraC-like DNA-binding protein